MALLQLGIANMRPQLEIGQVSQPSTVAPAEPQGSELESEVGATGTPIFGGFLREQGEYNAEWTWPASALLCEQMRRSDATVAAVLWASKLPIRGGEWAVVEPDNANAIEKEATEFVRQELFESIGLGSILENALLMFDFGAALDEDVWKVDGNRIRLAKVAPRLPLTFYRWICKPGTDELAVIEQLGYRAGQYVRTELPMEKCTLYTFRQEGANFTGRSLLREMYQHWYMKSGLYKVDAIACERNGMGVPVITMGPDAKAQDIASALGWVQSLVAHQKTGLVLPPSWTFALEGVKGTLRDPKDSIQHHNTMITVAGLAQFMMMGQQSKGSGNRSLGETMSDFFFMGLQATADQLGRRLTDTKAKRLVDFNFAGVTRYPKVVPQQIMALKFDAVVDALAKLGASHMVTDDLDLENWLRKKIGAPDKPAGAPRGIGPVVPPGANPTDEGAADGEGVDGAENEDPGANSGEGEGPEDLQASDTDFQPRRAPKGPEVHLALSAIVSALDQGRDEIAAALRGARPRIQAEILHRLLNKQVRNMHQASVPADQKLIDQVEGILRGISEFGTQQVTAERAKQLKGAAPEDAAKVRMDARGKRDALGLYADGVVTEFQNTLSSRATNAMVARRVRGDATQGALIEGVGEDLDEQSDKWIDGVASKGANEAFADGRSEGYAEYADEISSVIYSALLDINTCGPCSDADGQEGATPDDIPGAPNPDCDGGDRCRCVHVFVFADEVKSAA